MKAFYGRYLLSARVARLRRDLAFPRTPSQLGGQTTQCQLPLVGCYAWLLSGRHHSELSSALHNRAPAFPLARRSTLQESGLPQGQVDVGDHGFRYLMGVPG